MAMVRDCTNTMLWLSDWRRREREQIVTDEQVRDGFRNAMRRLATTIALVTTGRDKEWTGMAATAVVSVCAEPPTLLVAVNRTASIYPLLHAEKRFCVNLLAERHRDLVGIFSGQKKGYERFETGNWVAGPDGLPVLADALASLSCSTQSTIDVGTHTLFIGVVDQVINHDEINPLVWVDGSFASASR
jgi:flavin reductase